jgi:DNA-binding XRE family transcriptional regulator
MARKWSEVRKKLSPEREAKIKAKLDAEITKMHLPELRQAQQYTQTQLAEILKVPQSSISKIEQRTDMYVSTLRSYVRALGGDLEIKVVFPDGSEVQIDQFRMENK